MVAPQPVPVILVVGETGSGKALVARRLHYGARRAPSGPFVELNAAAIPETLIESELFGHERGAFSDARERKLGLVEVADGGTLFLDEIGDLAPARAGQAAHVPRVVQLPPRRRHRQRAPSMCGVVAATNRDLGAMVEGGPLPRRSLLSAERAHAARAAAPRAARGHRAARRALRRRLRAALSASASAAVGDDSAQVLARLALARQRPRAQGGRPARGAR